MNYQLNLKLNFLIIKKMKKEIIKILFVIWLFIAFFYVIVFWLIRSTIMIKGCVAYWNYQRKDIKQNIITCIKSTNQFKDEEIEKIEKDLLYYNSKFWKYEILGY